MTWDGQERRMNSHETLKLLNSMDKNLSLLTQSFQAQTKAFETHVLEDRALAEEVRKKLEFSNRVIYMGLGIVAFISFFANFIK